MFAQYLTFSDAAKFADVARNIFLGNGFGSNFTFFGADVFKNLSLSLFPVAGILPFTPFSIALFYKIFGIGDFAVIATSFFFFLLTLLFVYLLAKKLFQTNLVATLSTVAVGFNYDLISYATTGASESPFIFEIVASLYFITLRKRWSTAVSILLLILMYFTRPQAFIYIAGAFLFWLFIRFDYKKAFIYFIAASVVGALFDLFVLSRVSGKLFIYSVLARGQYFTSRYLPGVAVSDSLRGQSASAPFVSFLKKVFYDLYNFYKLAPQIINPYLLTIFVVGFFVRSREKIVNAFRYSSLFTVTMALVVTAASIPFFRYIHPIIPIVYIISVGTLYSLLVSTKIKRSMISVTLTILILFLGVGQTVGVLILDSRFVKNTLNISKPPAYVLLAEKLKTLTNKNQTVVTNLDTWGTWYGERKTIWFPLEPKQLIDPNTGKIPFDAVYLTSYLMNDENYYMGDSWRKIFNNPKDPKKWICDGCEVIAKEFKLKDIYTVSLDEDYERQDFSAILLIKK